MVTFAVTTKEVIRTLQTNPSRYARVIDKEVVIARATNIKVVVTTFAIITVVVTIVTVVVRGPTFNRMPQTDLV